MEEDEMPAQGCKFPRNHNSNGKIESSAKGGLDEEDGDEEVNRGGRVGGGGGGGGQGQGRGGRGGNISQVDISNSAGPLSRLCNWPSSRIFRVSRASGGKDRHSKVWTSKGLRDRRVRLSVPTAIQFYDLQDRLGYDQPSKAVEWLLTAAATSIAELPSISTPFPDTPQQLTDGRRCGVDNEKRLDLAEDEDENMMLQQQEANGLRSLSKSACSSTSETSKGSGLSFSRPESRIKARERARERAAGKEKEKEKEKEIAGCGGMEESRQRRQQNLNPISQNSSFTELLTGGGIHNNNNHSPSGNGHDNANESNFFQKSQREWISSTSMDYFGTGLLSPPASTSRPINSTNFLGQIQLGNPLHQQFSVTGDQNQQQFSFLPDHLVRGGGGGGGSNNNNNGDYNLNFSVTSSSSSGLAGFRGTLQSNSSSSPSMLPHIQRFPNNIDGTSAFFLSPTTPVTNASSVTPVENHYHHFLSGFDPQLQLCYDNTNRHNDHKGKGKNSAS